ncbi:MAG: hypothetical protein MPK62_08310 [Alphaproteobacteria bacterium]|nr:hypothetical protein [Alphaproteobacteria bacterium]
MAEDTTVKEVKAEEPKSKQEQEAAVINDAVKKGEVNPEYGVQEDGTYKVNLDAPAPTKEKKNETKEETKPDSKANDADADKGGVDKQSEGADTAQEQKEVPAEDKTQKSDDALEISLVSDEDKKVEKEVKKEKAVKKEEPAPEAPKVNLPENVEKLVQFMDETGGTVEDYVNLNKDISKLSENDILSDYYKQTKGWSAQEVREHIEDNFTYDKELDEPKHIRAIEREYKAELRDAKKFLAENKDKYYADLKLRKQNELAPEVKQAVDFYQQQQIVAEERDKLVQSFTDNTEKVFADLKGFDFKVGDQQYRVKVNNADHVKTRQLDINNFVNKFIGEDGTVADAAGYHRSLWAADNVDKLVEHFYELGKADAIKQRAAESKGINMDPRQQRTQDDVSQSGPKVRVVESNSDKLRFKNYRGR